MLTAFVLAVMATGTPTPTVTVTATPTPRPTTAAATAPKPGAGTGTYGGKVPFQLRKDRDAQFLPEPAPDLPASSLSDLASRTKLRHDGNSPISISNQGVPAGLPGSPKAATSSTPLPGDSEPYRLEVVAYERGDGMEIYAVAEDHAGREIACEGFYSLTITASGTRVVRAPCPWGGNEDCGEKKPFTQRAYSRSGDAKSSDFTITTVGLGAFAHPRLVLPLGRVPSSEMVINVEGRVSTLSFDVAVTLASGTSPLIAGGTSVTVVP